MYYVYLITDGKRIYTGFSADLKKRIKAHNQDKGKRRFTKGKTWKLIYYEAFYSRRDALKREQQLKRSASARRWLRERITDSRREAEIAEGQGSF